MRVATWNLWWKFGPWQERQTPIADELIEVDADVCCLQEVWSDKGGEDQAEVLADRTGRFVARTTLDDGSPHRFGNALLSRWPILESFTLDLPGVNGAPSHRSALFVRVDVPNATEPWWMISTHLEWRYDAGALRQQQLGAIVARIVDLRGANDEPQPTIIGADLNAVAESEEIRRLTGLSTPYVEGLVFTDSWQAVGDGPGHTWTRENPHSENAQWPRRRLDHILVSWPRHKPTGNPLGAALFGTKPRPSAAGRTARSRVVPSDHYGVVVDLDERSPEDLRD